jgi:hypothetical protein
VPPEASRALEHEIDGRKIGCDQVKVQIQTLLRHLGGNEDFPTFPAPTFSEYFQNQILALLPPISRKAGVEEEYFCSIGEALADTLAFALQRLALGEETIQVLGSLHRIDKREAHSTSGKMLGKSRTHAVKIRLDSLEPQNQAPCRIGLEMSLVHLAAWTENGKPWITRFLLRQLVAYYFRQLASN